MKYISTRGGVPPISFTETALSGLAPDGGLYMPESIPQFTRTEIVSWAKLSYQELAEKVMWPFVEGAIPAEDFRTIIQRSYKNFRHPEITPLHRLDDTHYILELFHGPTLAFKDIALQFLGQLFEYLLEKENKDLVIVGATSGDTGSAAIEGCRNCARVRLFMLHPLGRVSEVQRRQMTTVNTPNIVNLAVEGTFDDCQAMVKTLLRDVELNEKYTLSAVNSINWARIMAQIVYYFYAALKLGVPEKPVTFSVPTGNFGDIFAGYIAQRMGLPITKLIIATNKNDILHRFLTQNDYRQTGVTPTLAPSMDIQVSSNFERLLFALYGQDGTAIRTLMEDFSAIGKLKVSGEVWNQARSIFASWATDDAGIQEEMRKVYEATGYLIDPHTATGVNAAQHFTDKGDTVVILATAHPAKFPDAVENATGIHPALPAHLADLLQREEHFTRLPGELKAVKKHILDRLL